MERDDGGPVIRPLARVSPKHKAGASSLGAGGPCVVIVDDDPLVRRALRRELGTHCVVHEADSVRAASDLLGALPQVDLAFVDFDLPDGTGDRVLNVLMRWPSAIRILVSAQLGSERFRHCGALAHMVLGKPLAPRSIRSVLSALHEVVEH